MRHLHLGHLAKSFALREAPSTVTGAGAKVKTHNMGRSKGKAAAHANTAGTTSSAGHTQRKPRRDAAGDEYDVIDAEKRMEQVVRAQGRLTKKGGKMVSSGASEFQVAGGYALERLVGGRT